MSSASSSSSAVFRRFFFPPSTSQNKKGFAGYPTLRPIFRPSRILEFKSPKNVRKYAEPVETSFHKLSTLCSRHEHNSSEPPKPEGEGISHHLPEESMQAEFSHSSVPKRERDSTPQKFAKTELTIFGERWDVPWGAGTILQVLLLWEAVLWFKLCWMIPYVAEIVGFKSLTLRGEALFCLVDKLTDGLAAIAILRLCISRYRPLPPDWFRFSLKGKWPLDVILVCLMFPLAERLSQFNLNLRPLLASRPLTISGFKESIGEMDPVATALYAIAFLICGPVWEEIVFRGFILPSLTKYMPVWCAILVSSASFSLVHLNVPVMLQITFLSFMIGVTFARSRNLLPPVLLHSLWNSFFFFKPLLVSLLFKR